MQYAVITPVFGNRSTLTKCVSSVSCQINSNWSHFVIDGSPPHVADLNIVDWGSSEHIHYTREPDKNLYHAINKVIIRNSFQFYVVLGSDDFLLPGALDFFEREANNEHILMSRARNSKGQSIISHSGAMLLPTHLHEYYGLYDCSYNIAADTFLIETCKVSGVAIKDSETTTAFFNDGGLSTSKNFNVYREHARACYNAKSWSLAYYIYYLVSRFIKFLIDTTKC